MPTPPEAFVEIAVRYGDVPPDDVEAIVRFYREVLPTLPAATVDEILARLLECEGDAAGDTNLAWYPEQAPALDAQDAPPAGVPKTSAGWRRLLAWLLRHHRP